jgi:hypothetical protein
MCGVMLDCGSEVLQEYRVKYDRYFNALNLLEIDIVLAWSRHTTSLDPSVVFKEIMRHKPQRGNMLETYKSASR